MSIYYHCLACQRQWIGDLECPACGNRDLEGPKRITDGDSPEDVVEEAILAAYDAVCTCDDTHGDNPFCLACYPKESA